MSASIGPRFPGGVWHTGLDLMTVFNFPRPLPQLLTLRLCHCLGSFISVLDVTFQYSANGLQTLLKCSYRAISLHCLFGLAAQLCVPFFFLSEIWSQVDQHQFKPQRSLPSDWGENHLQNMSLPLQLHARLLLWPLLNLHSRYNAKRWWQFSFRTNLFGSAWFHMVNVLYLTCLPCSSSLADC